MKKSPLHSIKISPKNSIIPVVYISLILIMFNFAGCDYFFPPLSGDKIPVEEAAKFIQKNSGNPDVILLDIRTKKQYDSVRIENSVNFDFSQTDFPDQISKLDHEKRYIIIDENGRKAAMALELMREQRFPKIHYITGGINEWIKAGKNIYR